MATKSYLCYGSEFCCITGALEGLWFESIVVQHGYAVCSINEWHTPDPKHGHFISQTHLTNISSHIVSGERWSRGGGGGEGGVTRQTWGGYERYRGVRELESGRAERKWGTCEQKDKRGEAEGGVNRDRTFCLHALVESQAKGQHLPGQLALAVWGGRHFLWRPPGQDSRPKAVTQTHSNERDAFKSF